jgi:hypothetical protein
MAYLETMSATTCVVLAQVMPVFLIALVAERIGFKPGKNKRRTRYRLAVALARTFVDFILAVVLVMLELTFLAGIDRGGYAAAEARGL